MLRVRLLAAVSLESAMHEPQRIGQRDLGHAGITRRDFLIGPGADGHQADSNPILVLEVAMVVERRCGGVDMGVRHAPQCGEHTLDVL